MIHAPLYAALRRLPGAARSRFRRRVERLCAGDWGGGTRVTKLRGCAKPVFEARQDAGDRILFTVAHTAAGDDTGVLTPHLQIWDLVHHDGVSGRARRINPSAESEFLDFERVEAELIGAPPPRPAASFAEIPSLDGGREAGVVEFVLSADSVSARAHEELVGGVRWYVLPESLVVDESRWQSLMDRGVEELELKLTEEQYQVVRAGGPVLLSGSAGSGKTTIAVHRLAAAACGHGRPRTLYVTYSGWLLDDAHRLFTDLLACRGETPDVAPAFLTVHDLYRTIIGGGGSQSPARVVDYGDFARWYGGMFRRDDAALAWEEIRSIVKGANLHPGRPLLGRDEYEALGRKRAPLFVGERPRLYQVARRWQEHLEGSQLADEIDLCQLALARVPRDGLYDHVLCDEAQDLAEVQVELLLRLCRGPAFAGLFLAGDPQQVINPSGFRWAEVRSRIRDRLRDRGRPVPGLHVLTRNFRSVRGVVDLANEVLAFKRERVGRSDGDQPEESVVSGAVPILVRGEEAALAAAVRGFGPRCAVVAGSPQSRSRLQATLDTTRVFTVAEAKGLEFDAAILWSVVGDDPGPWRRLLDPALDLREDPASRRTLHHLYVAVTRARRHLAVYEPAEAPPLWTADRFRAKLDDEAPESLSRLFVQSATPEEWQREGEYFLARGRHRQAAECFRRGGDARRESESLARHHEAAGEPALAAERWLALGETVRAARCLEQAGDYAGAAREWSRAGDEAAARRCLASASEAAGRWSDAAAAWEELQAWESAARCWANAGVRARQSRCLALGDEQGGRPAAAAQRWEEIEEWARAAAAWRASGREREARGAEARACEAAGRWEEAARAWEDAGDRPRAVRGQARAAEHGGRWEAAARAWEEAGDFAAAVRAWQNGGKPEESRRCGARRDVAEGRFVRAAEALEELGDFAAAAEAWGKAAAARQQPATPSPLPLPAAASRAWCEDGKPARLARPPAPRRRGGRRPGPPRRGLAQVVHDSRVRSLVCAARHAEDAARFDEAATAWRALGDDEQALRCRVAHLEGAGKLADAAALLETRQRYGAAAAAWRRAGETRRASRCDALRHEKKGRFEDAAAAWASLGEPVPEARSRAIIHFRRGEYDEAARHYDRAGSAEMAVTARLLAAKLRGDYDGAARIVSETGRDDLRPRLLGDRARWLAEAREMAAAAARRRARASATASRAAQPSLFTSAAGGEPGPAGPAKARTGEAVSASGEQTARRTDAAADLVLAAVRRHPGLTCEDIVEVTGLRSGEVKPLLAALAQGGLVVKTGRTRGTRYSPA